MHPAWHPHVPEEAQGSAFQGRSQVDRKLHPSSCAVGPKEEGSRHLTAADQKPSVHTTDFRLQLIQRIRRLTGTGPKPEISSGMERLRASLAEAGLSTRSSGIPRPRAIWATGEGMSSLFLRPRPRLVGGCVTAAAICEERKARRGMAELIDEGTWKAQQGIARDRTA